MQSMQKQQDILKHQDTRVNKAANAKPLYFDATPF